MQAKPGDATESAPNVSTETILRRRSRRILFVVLVAMLVLSVGLYWALARYYSGLTATLGSQVIEVEVVNTPALREQGLSGRDSMSEDRGMLFVFDKPDLYCFWMKDMRFPIDIIWLDGQKRVVKIQKNAQPASYPEHFCPQQSTEYVLEVVAGSADKSGLKEGDQVHTRSGLVL